MNKLRIHKEGILDIGYSILDTLFTTRTASPADAFHVRRAKLLHFIFCGFTFFISVPCHAQISYTANDLVPAYNQKFHPGINPGYIPSWADEQLADLSAGNPAKGVRGMGVKALRPALYEDFLETYGYDYRDSTFQYYAELGLSENTIIVGFPVEEHRDRNEYCTGTRSELFANLYEPIWDDGANGTPVNEENYYALYLYRLAQDYGDHARFWEIWNEPGFDYTGALGWFQPGQDGNWWDNDPNPCDYKLRAPIQHFVRTLRISYEVLKYVQPDDYVVLSGTGYPSFLDAILRNTDNPVDGSVTAKYPLGGGAYFDVMGFHSYPHFDGSVKVWSDDIGGWDYSRHSDAAARGVINTKHIYEDLLADYGYGSDYPEKLWVVTECNIPRRPYADYIGGEEVQRNFTMKAYLESVRNDILQLHIYALGEEETAEKAASEFEVMGLYQKLFGRKYPYAIPNEQGVAYRTCSEVLFPLEYDASWSTALQAVNDCTNEDIEDEDTGCKPLLQVMAFKDEFGNYTYALWAVTDIDQSETANATFSFPADYAFAHLEKRTWDYSEHYESEMIATQNIELTATPIFLTERLFSLNANRACAPFELELATDVVGTDYVYEWTVGEVTESTNQPNYQINLSNPINYPIELKIKNAAGEIVAQQQDEILIEAAPQPAFDHYHSGVIANFTNLSSPDADGFLWEFGDGEISTEANPEHVFSASGNFNVELTATNECGATTISESFDVELPHSTRLTQTANDVVKEYDGYMRAGMNFGVYRGWTDEMLADISAGNLQKNIVGVGARAVRPALYDHNLATWGYDVLTDSYAHFENLNLKENTVIVGFPRAEYRDPNYYCPTHQSEHFEGLYLDIWDDGTDGTPINDENLYAKYLYETVLELHDYTQFWEIWNEPSFDYSSFKGWLPKGERYSWWDEDPDPCDYKLRAPIQHFVRVLRISYEIIKTYDPDAYVTLSGVGFPSFLDALLRNTDNPKDGSVSATYPQGAGAYFDVMGFHSYPHFDGSTARYDTLIGDWIYNRHSDAAAAGISRVQDNLQAVLSEYGYDGTTYPEKEWVVTEINIPRKQIGNYIGSEVAQRNFMLKAYVEAMTAGMLQFDVYSIAEEREFDDAFFEFEVMGLYEKLDDVAMENAQQNEAGIALKTASDLLYGTRYDVEQTAAMQLPDEIKGAAFRDANGDYLYALWAKTTEDMSEEAGANYSFPSEFDIDFLYKKGWNFSQTLQNEFQQATDIPLTATPIFLSPNLKTLAAPTAAFRAETPVGCAPLTTQFFDLSVNAETWQWEFAGGNPATSTEQNPNVTFSESGTYPIRLTVKNAAGEHSVYETSYLVAQNEPDVGFTYRNEGARVFFTVDIPFREARSFYWDFGNGFANPAYNPEHFYFYNGEYEVTLITTNDCGVDTFAQTVIVAEPPTADFITIYESECGATTRVEFKDYSISSPTSYQWILPNSTHLTATDIKDPIAEYAAGGTYEATLIVANENGRDTIIKSFYIGGDVVESYEQTICEDEQIIVNGTTYHANHLSGTEYLPNATVAGCDSTIYVHLTLAENTYSTIYKTLCVDESIIINGTIYNSENTGGVEVIPNGNIAGCDSIIQVALSFYESPQVVDYQIINATNLAGGSIDLNIQNGTPPYIITWSNGMEGAVISGLETGAYEALITDANGCSITASFMVGFMTSTSDVVSDWSVAIFPNPSRIDKVVSLEIEGRSQEVFKVQLMDVQGRVVRALTCGHRGCEVTSTGLKSGVYFWSVVAESGERVILKQVIF